MEEVPFRGNKFAPPRLDPERLVFRKQLVGKLVRKGIERRKLIFIEAQAGQGKSVFAAQFLAYLRVIFCWYQLGAEDGDPIFFLKTLLAALSQSLPGFRSPLLENMLAKKEAAAIAAEHSHNARVLVHDLGRMLTRDFFIVFDDVYFLEKYTASLDFLTAMIKEEVPRLHFVLISRRSVLPSTQQLLAKTSVYSIGNDELALNKGETGELYAEKMKVAVSTELVQHLHVLTEGWVMGLVLAGQVVDSDPSLGFVAGSLPALFRGSVVEYFRGEVLAALPEKIRLSMFRLSLLDQVPAGLAAEIAHRDDIIPVLDDFVRRNFFIRSTGGEEKAYIFHHLFQDCLRQEAAREIREGQKKVTYRKAADWFLAQNRPEEALAYFLKAEDYEAAHRLMSSIGMALVSDHRIVTLKQALDVIPDEVVIRYPWFSYLYGVVCLDYSPPEALPHFERSRELFRAAADSFGELLAMAQTIYFRLLVDGQYQQGELLLGSAEELFGGLGETMPVPIAIQIGQILAAGNCFFRSDMKKAGFYSSMALQMAIKNDMQNFIAALRVGRCYEHGFLGRWPGYRAEIERSLPLFDSPRVSSFNKLSLRIAAVNLLDMEGDFDNYHYHKERLEKEISGDLLSKSIAAPFLLIWDIDILVAQGRNQEAIRLARQGLALPHAGANAHLRSQFLHYLAFLHAARGDRQDAVSAAEESLRLRAEAGGAAFRILNSFIVGGAYALMGDFERAEDLLERAITRSVDLNDQFIRAGAHVHRAHNRLRAGRKDEVLADLRDGLRCLKRNQYVHFFCWSPHVMQEILSVAVRENVEPEYARYLAAERLRAAILPDGKMIPLLMVRCLGGLELGIPGAGRVSTWDLIII